MLCNVTGKSSTGWDTARLFLGSEGTLGIVTRITVRLAPLLPLRVALTSFPTVSDAVKTSIEIIKQGFAPTSLELLDDVSIKGLNLANLLEGRKLPERPTVLMRFSGSSREGIERVLIGVKAIVQENRGDELWIARDDMENDLIWTARKVSARVTTSPSPRTLLTCVPAIVAILESATPHRRRMSDNGKSSPCHSHTVVLASAETNR